MRVFVQRRLKNLPLIVLVVGISAGWHSKAAAEAPVAALGETQVSHLDDSYLADEAKQRLGELSNQDLKEAFDHVDSPAQFELNVPWSYGETKDSPSERVISLWFGTARGTFAVELLDPGQQLVASWQGGRRGDQSFVRKLVPGKYVVRVQPLDGARVYGVIGFKVLYSNDTSCPVEGELTEHPPDPRRGYSWPYLLIKPQLPPDVPRLPGSGTLLVIPNNTALPTEDIQVIRAMAKCALSNSGDVNAIEIAKNLGTPILVPLFPRPELKEIASNLQLQGLTRASLEEELPRFARVDRQLIAMIDDARTELAISQPVQRRVLMAGLSAAGMFTNRFTMLHPELVLAAAVCSPGSWPVAPVAVERSVKLRYPIGIADAEKIRGHPIDLPALRRVRLLFSLGDTDMNDAVEHRDNYASRDSEHIERLFGETMIARWAAAERLYRSAGLNNAKFKLYSGMRHEVTPEVRAEILETFRTALGVP